MPPHCGPLGLVRVPHAWLARAPCALARLRPRRKEGIPDGVLVAPSLRAAVELLSAAPYDATVERVFVMGGAAAFAEALAGGGGVVCDTVYLTRVLADVPCDVAIPEVDDAVYALDEMRVRGAAHRWRRPHAWRRHWLAG